MEYFEVLHDLMQICIENKIGFDYTKEGKENSIIYQKKDKLVVLNVANTKDEKLKPMIIGMIDELKEML